MEKVSDALAKASVLGEKGDPRALGTFWAERAVVLLFVRHFG
jgi:hypothetical protein